MTNVTTPRGHISLDDEVDQPIPPEVWTRLVFQGQDAFVLVQGLADIDIQLYPADIVDPLKRPKVWQTMVRRLDGTKDGNVTGREPITWPQIRNACIRYLNLNLGVEPGVPLTFDVWHNAPSTVILTKRVPKLFVKRVDG